MLTLFNGGYLKTDEETTFKEDLQNMKKFIFFIKDDLLGKIHVF